MLSWQVEAGADEAVLDEPSDEMSGLTADDFILGSNHKPVSGSSAFANSLKTAMAPIKSAINKELPETVGHSSNKQLQITVNRLNSLRELN